MKHERKITRYSCDICGADDIQPARLILRKVTGYSALGGSAYGVEVIVKPFGDYREHVCERCAQQAVLEAAAVITPAEPKTVASVDPEDICPKCSGTGWVRGHELDEADEDTQADTMTRYSCDSCNGTGNIRAPAAAPTCAELRLECIGVTNGCHCPGCMGASAEPKEGT